MNPSIRKRLLLAGGVVLIGLFALRAAQNGAGSVDPIPPVTIVLEERQFNPAIPPPIGPNRVSFHRTVAHRGDGAKAQFTDEDGIAGYKTLEVSLPGRILIQAFPEIEAFTAVKLPPKPEQEAASRLLPSSDCAVRADGMMPRGAAQPGEVILGYRTARFVQDSPSRRSTVWLSPDLGCVEVRTLMEFKDKAGNITDWSDQVVTSITKSVDPLMFSIPKSYELIDPEELFRRSIIHKKGVSPDEPFMGTLKSAADRFARYRFDPREP